MSTLFWPGDERAGKLMSEPAMLHAIVRVESAWLQALVTFGIAGGDASAECADLINDEDVADVATRSEAAGNPVIPLLALLRERLRQRNPTAAAWLHRGLTSQDVLDTALILCAGEVIDRLHDELVAQIVALAGLAERYRASLITARTLTQHAVPITFGLKAAGWLQGVLDAADGLVAAREGLASQFGGAAGNLAAPTELAVLAGLDDAPQQAQCLVAQASTTLGLRARPPWHTSRATITRLGDALLGCTDAWGRIANDVLTLSRPEIAELAEPTADGRGSSSTMPHKRNPVLSVLIHRAALAAPMTGAQLHVAAAESRDERPDGAWHLEWATLQTLARRSVVAGSQTSELLTGLQVDVGRMRTTLDAATADVLAERHSLVTLFPDATTTDYEDLATYLGANDFIIDAVLDRAKPYLEGTQ